MGRKWLCKRRLYDFAENFTPGKVYEADKDGHITSDFGHVFMSIGPEINKSWISRHYIFEEVTSMFTKADLRIGDVITMGNGTQYIFMVGGVYTDGGTFVGIHQGDTCWLDPNDYNEDLKISTTRHEAAYNIMKVYRPKHRYVFDIEKGYAESHRYEFELVFDRERDMPKPKELTVGEIEKLLGYSVKIVKED